MSTRDIETGERRGEALGLGQPFVSERSVAPAEEEPGPVRRVSPCRERDHDDAGERSRPDRRKSSRRPLSARPNR